MDQTKLKDRRQHPRTTLSLPVRLRAEGSHYAAEFVTSNVSEGGLFIPMTSPYPVGTKLDLRIYLASLDTRIEAKAKVVRCEARSGQDGSPAGMAVQFTEHGEIGWRFFRGLLES
jgi:Tfp pilus assembly protein PilZ